LFLWRFLFVDPAQTQMYRAAIRERARDGIRTHGTLRAYLADFHACSKVFEMFVAERMARELGVPFWLWEDVPHEIKAARGLARRDLGIDVTDGATTIVQCKLRARTVTWAECATFFGCAISFAEGAYGVPWQRLVLARNACSKLSSNFAEFAATMPFDSPIGMDEFGAFVQGTLEGDEPKRSIPRPAPQKRRGSLARKPARHARRISEADRLRKIVITQKCIMTFTKWRDKGESFRVDRYGSIGGRCLRQVMYAKTKVTKTKTALIQETYTLSDLKHDLHCGFVELGEADD
jgi:hypothetical protein